MKELSVRLNGNPVGKLGQTINGKMTFTYERGAANAISLNMPIREESYGEIECEAFFGGLLPESDATKRAIGMRYGISHHNTFALLKAIGYDCAGAISFHHLEEAVQLTKSVPLEGKTISEQELYEHIQALPKKPLFMGFEGLRLSLAGVHDKAAVCLIDNKIALPKHGCPTTHILKPAAPGLQNIVENEYFCLKLGAEMGLTTPSVEIRQIKDTSFLLIERYDRKIIDNEVERIHQEDFCQALGVVSIKKYQSEGGPGFKEVFNLLSNTTQPAIDRNKLAAALVFNYLIGNMDAHGKNFSLLYKPNSQITLAPFYDLLCTRIYPALTDKMAMKIGNKYEADQVLPRHWEQLCHEIDYAYPALKKLIKKQGEAILFLLKNSSELTQGINQNFIAKLSMQLERHIDKTLNRLEKS